MNASLHLLSHTHILHPGGLGCVQEQRNKSQRIGLVILLIFSSSATWSKPLSYQSLRLFISKMGEMACRPHMALGKVLGDDGWKSAL